MNIEVGMYVRINDDFRKICLGIGKIKNIVQDSVYVTMSNIDLPISFQKKNIEKASHNIVDLIKVGDYVNGVEVEKINDKEIMLVDTHLWIDKKVANKLINSILTKEQFDVMKYVIERDG